MVTTPSYEPMAKYFPSAVSAPFIVPVPGNSNPLAEIDKPVGVMSQTRARPSSPKLMRFFPSGVNKVQRTVTNPSVAFAGTTAWA